jgi:hypothetical protein
MLNINTFWMCALTDIPYVLHKLSLLPTGRTQKAFFDKYDFSGRANYIKSRRKPCRDEQRGGRKEGIKHAFLPFFQRESGNITHYPDASIYCLLSTIASKGIARFSSNAESAEFEMALGLPKIQE